MSLTKEQKEDLCAKIDWEGLDYFILYYTSGESLMEEYKDKALVEKFELAKKSLEDFSRYIGLGENG